MYATSRRAELAGVVMDKSHGRTIAAYRTMLVSQECVSQIKIFLRRHAIEVQKLLL